MSLQLILSESNETRVLFFFFLFLVDSNSFGVQGYTVEAQTAPRCCFSGSQIVKLSFLLSGL